MLIQFRVENHRSLRDEQTLSLVAAKLGSDNNHLLRPEGLNEALLPAVALYGANASGKTNVLLALAFMRDAVISSHRLWEPESGVPQESFALSDQQHAPSFYEADILAGGVRYQYGFSLDAEQIEEEWLYAWPHTRRQMWFRRDRDRFDFGRGLHGENDTIRGLTRPNSLFLSAAAQNNHPSLLPIYSWFQRLQFELRQWKTRSFRGNPFSRYVYRMLDGAMARQLALFADYDETLQDDRQAIVRLLQSADTGIVDLHVEREVGEERGGGSSGRTNVLFRHKTDDPERAWLPLEVESAGTVALLELATRLIPVLRSGGVLCLDEIEASLHPMLAYALVHQFCDRAQNPMGAQLIFTTHDTNLLGTTLGFSPLRRDQVWLTEKDDEGATHLYPLTDFHPRKQENLERGYLQGRYGAVPFLGGLVEYPTTTERP